MSETASTDSVAGKASIELSMSELFRIASKARDNAYADADYALVAIVFSVIALESTINDLVEFCSFTSAVASSSTYKRIAEAGKTKRFDRWTLKEKFAAVFEAVSSSRTKWDEEPWRALDCLVEVRNEIIHRHAITGTMYGYSVAGLTTHPVKRGFMPYLVAEGLAPKEEIAGISWPYSVRTPTMARWALKTCIRCAGAAIEVLPDGQPRSALESEFNRSVRGYLRE